MAIEAYPLCWPVGWTRKKHPETSRFKVQYFARVRDELIREIELLRGTNIVLSSNLTLRRDGLPMANQRQPDDKGVAVYFTRSGKQVAMACDRWDKVGDNIRALQLSIAAIRGIERWGCSEFMERSFTGFDALPEARQRDWWEVLGVEQGSSSETVRARYRQLARRAHPDTNGGDGTWMAEINAAFACWEQSVK